MVYKFLDKKSLGGPVARADKSAFKSKIFLSQQSSDFLGVARFLTVSDN